MRSEAVRQIIAARGGTAYGVVNGDLFTVDARPIRHVLTPWASSPATELPKPHHLDQLNRWCETGARLSVRWLHGGDTESRRALRDSLAAARYEVGWTVLTTVTASELPENTSVGYEPPHGSPGVLLIIDDADTWSISDLTWLLSDGAVEPTRLPVRVLLLAVEKNGWPQLRASLAQVQAATYSHDVGGP